MSDKKREAFLAQQDRAEPVRDLLEKLFMIGPFLHEELLSHLANRHNRWCQPSAPAIKNLGAFFAQLPVTMKSATRPPWRRFIGSIPNWRFPPPWRRRTL
mgnify:CR=1 FL=1